MKKYSCLAPCTRLGSLFFLSFQCCCISTSSQEIVRFSNLHQTFQFYFLITHSDAAVASFSDPRCEADGVCPSDPLTFTCEINGAVLLRVVFPDDEQAILSVGSDLDDVVLPDGFAINDLVIREVSGGRDFVLTFSITSASLLNGGEIRCDDTFDANVAMAGCPILGKSCFQALYGHKATWRNTMCQCT